jgi:hypothetical protein
MIEKMENKYHKINKILEYKSSLMNLTKEIKIPKNLKYKKNNSITLDDIYHCGERNRWIYDDFQEVYPLTIGETQLDKYIEINNKTTRKSTIKNLKQKNYIRIGEECPICYDDIVNKKQAFLTECGHAFHYECIQNYYNSDYIKFGWCPMCRQDTGDCGRLKRLYCNSSNNKMDKYENFWNEINILLPDKCYTWINDNHYLDIHNLGMDKNCIKCINYRTCISSKYKGNRPL